MKKTCENISRFRHQCKNHSKWNLDFASKIVFIRFAIADFVPFLGKARSAGADGGFTKKNVSAAGADGGFEKKNVSAAGADGGARKKTCPPRARMRGKIKKTRKAFGESERMINFALVQF